MTDSKAELRKRMQQTTGALADEYKFSQAAMVQKAIEQTPEFANAHTILLYHSMPNELPTHSMLEQWSKTKNLLLPRVDGDSLRIYSYDTAKLQRGAFGIVEPMPSCQEWQIADVDLVIVPGVAFDDCGHRLGHGKGFYDRLLQHARAICIGVAFDCQIVAEVPTDAHDITMDIIASGSHLLHTTSDNTPSTTTRQ